MHFLQAVGTVLATHRLPITAGALIAAAVALGAGQKPAVPSVPIVGEHAATGMRVTLTAAPAIVVRAARS